MAKKDKANKKAKAVKAQEAVKTQENLKDIVKDDVPFDTDTAKGSKVVSKEPAKPAKAKKAKAGKKALKLGHEKPSMSKAAIEKRITAKIEAEAKTSIEIGVLLEQAKFYFYEGKKLNGSAHTAWAEETFGFARSQTYKYIKIGQVFGELEGFDGVPMSVLAVMSSDDNILKAAIKDMKQAKKDKDEEFKIDNVWLKGYKAQLDEERKLLAAQKAEGEDISLEEELESYNLDQVRELFEKLTGEPAGGKKEPTLRKAISKHEDEDVEKAIFDIAADKKAEAEKNATVKKAVLDKAQAENDALKAELELLKATKEELEHKVSEAPQGDGETLNARDKALYKVMSKQAPHVVLGLPEGSNKRDVNKAKRALEAVYGVKNAWGCESIWNLIVEAAEKLTA